MDSTTHSAKDSTMTSNTVEGRTADQISDYLTDQIEDAAVNVSRYIRRAQARLNEAQDRMAQGGLPTYGMTSDILGQSVPDLHEASAKLAAIMETARGIVTPAAIEAAYAAGVKRDGRWL